MQRRQAARTLVELVLDPPGQRKRGSREIRQLTRRGVPRESFRFASGQDLRCHNT
jgi:hypothetical protein